MNRNEALQIWAERCEPDGGHSTPDAALAGHLQQDVATRIEVLDDGTMDALLRGLAQIEDRDEDFVDQVLARLDARQRDRATEAISATVEANGGLVGGLVVRELLSTEATDCAQEIVAPPIAAPPIAPPVAVRSMHLAGRRADLTQTNTIQSVSATKRPIWQYLTAAVALLAAFTGGAAVGRFALSPTQHAQLPPDDALDDLSDVAPAKPSSPATVPRRAPVARLVAANDCEWGGPGGSDHPRPGSELGIGRHELKNGRIELELSSGAKFSIAGPAAFELLGGDALRIDRGRLDAAARTSGGPCEVWTPSARITDPGAAFHVNVDGQFDTHVTVDQGRVWLEPRATSRDEFSQAEFVHAIRPLDLAAGGLDQAVVSRGDSKLDHTSVETRSSASPEQFAGFMSAGGRVLECRSPEAFAQIRDELRRHADESPQQFADNWSRLVDMLGGRLEMELKASVGDEPREFRDFEALRRALGGGDGAPPHQPSQEGSLPKAGPRRDEVQQPGSPPDRPPIGRGGPAKFHGTLMINGQLRTFDSREEFDKASRELLKPLEDFGIDLRQFIGGGPFPRPFPERKRP